MKKHDELKVWLSVVLALWVLQSPLSQAAQDCGQGERLYKQALDEQDAKQRIELLSESIKRCPSFEGWYIKGRSYVEIGNTDWALAAYQDALNLAADDRSRALALGRRGEVLVALNKDCDAADALEKATRLFPGDKPDWMLAAYQSLEERQVNTAVSAQTIQCILGKKRSFGVMPAVHLRIHFAYNSDRIEGNGQQQVVELQNALRAAAFKTYSFRIIGHTDSRGTPGYNEELSKRRARAVVAALANNAPELKGRMHAEGRGKRELRYKGGSDKSHRLNRRVEVQLVKR